MSQTKAQLLDGKSATIQFTGGSASAPSVSFTGDTNTGIYSPGADQVAISTGGSGRLFVDANGNLSVGGQSNRGKIVALGSGYSVLVLGTTSSSGARGGAINFESEAPGADGQILYDTNSDYMSFSTNANERLRITSTGLVGVGTSSPGARLHSVETSAAEGLRVDGAAGGFSLVVEGGTTRVTRIRQATIGNSYGGNTPPTDGLLVQGSVGIGTSSPAVPLHVSGDGNSLRLQRSTYSGTGETVSLDFRHFASNLSADYAGATITSVTTNSFTAGGGAGLFDAALTFSTLNDAVSAERMRISSSGNVGIGTTSPSSTLQVSPSSGSANFQVSRGSKGLQINQDSDSADPNINTIGASALRFLRDGGESMRIDTSGRLLVGTSSSAMSGGVVQQNGNLGIIANTATNVATNGTLDITISNGGSCFTGFMIVENTLDANAAARTQTLYAVMGRGTSATFTSLATANGSTSGASFSLSCPSNGVIRVTNTHGGATNINLCWYGPTGY